MGGKQDAEGQSGQDIAVIDGDVRESGWHQLDLDEILKPLPKAQAAGPILLAAPGVGPEERRPQIRAKLASAEKRVPASAFVSIGYRRRAPVPGYPANRTLSRSANDNHTPVGDRRSIWRDLFFLVVLGATVAGAFWSGRLHGYQKVIVVPGPSSFYSVVT